MGHGHSEGEEEGEADEEGEDEEDDEGDEARGDPLGWAEELEDPLVSKPAK